MVRPQIFQIFLIVLLMLYPASGEWKGDKDGAGESFEADSVPAYITADNSKVAVTSKRYKHGSKSLCWTTSPGASLKIQSPELKANGGAKNSGVMLWYYNEKPQDGKLAVDLLSDGKKVFSFPLGLNFKGWRAAWVSFQGDLKPLEKKASLAGEIAMVVTAPTKGTGDIYLDAVRFTKSSSWRRSKDNQVPFVRASTDTHWQHSYDASLIKPSPAPKEITSHQKEAFAKISKRYDDWALGRTLDNNDPKAKGVMEGTRSHIRRGKAYFKKLNIRCVDGVYTGQPFFAGRSSLTPNFCENLFQNAPLALALDYRINGDKQSAKDFVTLMNFSNDQGWADGSAIGTLDHEMLRSAGYMHAVFLMRDVLREASILKRELATMRWHCFFNMIYQKPVHAGTNADRMRTVTLYMLLAILAMDDTPDKVRDMQCLLRWQNNACRIAPGWADTIKPDFTGYHHAGIYANAYSPGALQLASFAAYLQHETRFAFDDTSLENLKQALFTARVINNLHDTPPCISGRMPFCSSTWLRYSPAFAYLAQATGDDSIAAAFKRLWERATKKQRESVLFRQSVGIAWYAPAGLLPIIDRVMKLSVKAEPSPEGNWSKPYGALVVQRRGDWMAMVKGYGQYVWDVEKHSNQNIYGLFIGYGSVTIYGSGDPVSAAGSGYTPNGWDWRLWPGTTAPFIPYEQFEKHEDVRFFSPSRMAGGVSDGNNGIFGLHLIADKYGFKLDAKKTVFMKDGLLVCLGSDIKCSGTTSPVNTCIFQTSFSKDSVAAMINGKKITGIPHESKSAELTVLKDSVGNRYIVPAGQELHVRCAEQESRHERRKKPTKGKFATAWLTHGTSPKDAKYNYAIQVQPETTEPPAYKVIQRDSTAHVVKFPGGYTGYCIFDASGKLPDGTIAAVDRPCLIMVEPKGDKLQITVANPDLNFDLEKLPAGLHWVRGHNRYAPSRLSPVRVTLNGKKGKIEKVFKCIDGKSISVMLEGE